MRSNSSDEVPTKKLTPSPTYTASSSDDPVAEYSRSFTRKWVEYHTSQQPIVVDDDDADELSDINVVDSKNNDIIVVDDDDDHDDELSSQGSEEDNEVGSQNNRKDNIDIIDVDSADNESSSRDDDDNESLSMYSVDEDYYESEDVFFESDEDYSSDSGTSSNGSTTVPKVGVIRSEDYVPLLAVAHTVAPLYPPIRRIAPTATVTAHPVPITIPSASPHHPLPPNHLFTNAHHPVLANIDTIPIVPIQSSVSRISAASPPVQPQLNSEGNTTVSLDALIDRSIPTTPPSSNSVNEQTISAILPHQPSNTALPADSSFNDIDFDLRMASAILSKEAFPTNLLASDESHSLPPPSPRFTPSPSTSTYLSE